MHMSSKFCMGRLLTSFALHTTLLLTSLGACGTCTAATLSGALPSDMHINPADHLDLTDRTFAEQLEACPSSLAHIGGKDLQGTGEELECRLPDLPAQGLPSQISPSLRQEIHRLVTSMLDNIRPDLFIEPLIPSKVGKSTVNDTCACTYVATSTYASKCSTCFCLVSIHMIDWCIYACRFMSTQQMDVQSSATALSYST